MSPTFSKVIRRGLLVLGGLFLVVCTLPFVIEFVQWCGGNHYPCTAQQAGAISLLGTGKQVATAIYAYRIDHNEWPATLDDVIKEGLLTKKQVCSYPKTNDLPDRRDMQKMKDFEDWIYVKPQENSPDLPMVIAPRPYMISMGRTLPRPRRIVVDRETRADSIEEDKIAPILRQPAGK